MTELTKAEKQPLGLGFDSPLFRSSLFHLNPFGLMRQFAEEMDRTLGAPANSGMWAPAVEVKESNGNLIVTAELPGLKKEEVKVTITGDQLCLEGERKEQKEEKKNGSYRSERSYGHFYRALPLPKGAKADQATARFTDGLLEITVPVPALDAAAQTVPIIDSPKAKV